MQTTSLPPAFELLFNSPQQPAGILAQVVRLTGEILEVDRCFLYVRDPQAGKGRIAFCWRKNDSIPDVTEPDWKDDTTSLPLEDPLFAAALSTKPSVYITDVETAPPDVLNRHFEARTFGHRALIHAHLIYQGVLWGILQPCVFGQPREWTAEERQLIELVLPHVAPVAATFVRSAQVS